MTTTPDDLFRITLTRHPLGAGMGWTVRWGHREAMRRNVWDALVRAWWRDRKARKETL